MIILLTGGGSGGHITPVLAVADELKKLQPDLRVIYIGQKGDKLADIPREHPSIDEVQVVWAGKFRRYHGEGLKQLLDIKTIFKNFRDMILVLVGFAQSFFLLRKLRPTIIFSRGGFVSVPVCLGGKLAGIPYVTHDSDAVPSLANRLIAKWATLHAVALPKEVYSYPADKTVTVGVPISNNYQFVTDITKAKQKIGAPPMAPLLLVTGGGNGALRLNEAIAEAIPDLLKSHPTLWVVQLTGRDHEETIKKWYDDHLDHSVRGQVAVRGFVTNLYDYSAAADVVVARAGATNMAEFAAQGKACVIVPNPMLTGGHQTKNAKTLADSKAIGLVEESQLKNKTVLTEAITGLLDNPVARTELSRNLHVFAKPDAAKDIAVILLEQARKVGK